ncbi:protein Wnt-4 isoform X1 [Anopheles moucheti]|uniref:protein Wnt-4 isoform X1 n=1 Tax=Anopheles moucheti TaxID=186751 RepID=UPI0022F0B701|nr:protein Wnt-4 isoform X1 [Anopheles moucheti]
MAREGMDTVREAGTLGGLNGGGRNRAEGSFQQRNIFASLLILSAICCFIECNDVITSKGDTPSSSAKNTVMAVFSPMIKTPGPCKFLSGTRKQNHQCRRDIGLPEAIKEARRLAVTHCEEQFRYDRWNCSIETRGKRNIFKKVYRETAFVHALTAAAITHAVARACAEGKMTKCQCASERKPEATSLAWRWGGCSDNLKHGKRVARNFLELQPKNFDPVAEMLRHDSEVGISAITSAMTDRCKCHGVSGSCSMKTCWRRLGDFNTTAALLRTKYHLAIRKIPVNNKTSRRSAPRDFRPRVRQSLASTETPKMKRNQINRVQCLQETVYDQLYYFETSPTFCSVTRGRRCLHPDNCATLCCGRGYTTKVIKTLEKCRCRFTNGRCCQVVCDYCEKYEDRYYCK